MKHSVRSTLAALALGVVVQRAAQLLLFLCIGRALGVTRLGDYAAALAVGSTLAVLAGAGVRNLLARAIARDPAAAGPLVARAVRNRLRAGLLLLLLAGVGASVFTAEPWLWWLGAAHVLPAAFDLKNLLDAADRTRGEVQLETTTAVLLLAVVGGWLWAGGQDLRVLLALSLCARSAYALGALRTIAVLPQATPRPLQDPPRRDTALVALGQTAHELLAAGDVWLVGILFGSAATGLYATAQRLAGAALVPSGQLARLLLPHLLRAAAAGDPTRTTTTALRATAFATLPMLAGGVVVGAPLCSLFGADFLAAAPALALLLAAGTLQHFGWQCSHALFAAGRDRAYGAGLLWPAILHAGLLGGLGGNGATAAALAVALAMAGYALGGAAMCPAARTGLAPRALVGPLLVAVATAGGAAAPAGLPAPYALPSQLLLGAGAGAAALWAIELRGRLRRIGDGLAAASGLRHG